MEKLFENVNGNQFKLISEGVEENEPKSSLIRKGLRKVFSEGEKEYSYKKLQGVGLGYIRNVSEAKKCALQEARELALEFGYEDQEQEQKFVKEDDDQDNNANNPEFQEKDRDQFRKDRSNSPEGEEVRKNLKIKEDETDMSDPEEKREVQIGQGILRAIDDMARSGGDITSNSRREPIDRIRILAMELIRMHGQR